MPPTLKETVMALLGAAVMLALAPYIILGGAIEYAVVIYVFKQVTKPMVGFP